MKPPRGVPLELSERFFGEEVEYGNHVDRGTEFVELFFFFFVQASGPALGGQFIDSADILFADFPSEELTCDCGGEAVATAGNGALEGGCQFVGEHGMKVAASWGKIKF